MQGLGMSEVLGRVGLALATFGLAVSGVVVATEGSTFPGVGPTVALTPASVVSCLAAGVYEVPEPGSVGLPAGQELCASGPLTVAEAGTVLDGWDVRGGIVVDAPDVVIRRSRITGDGTMAYGIHTTDRGSVRIEDTTLTGNFPEAAIGDERWTATRIEVTGVTHDGARLGDGARLRNSSLHGFVPEPEGEPDALVLLGSTGDILVEDNRIEMRPGAGSAVRVAPTEGQNRGAPLVIRGNVLGGGRYTVQEDSAAVGRAEVWITDNRFQRDAPGGPLRVSPRVVLTDNTYLDGGPLPGS